MTSSLSRNSSDLNGYRKSVLSNGVRVISDTSRHVQSVSLGIWVRAGSRFEPPQLNGISHFIEHMLFKGTPTRDAFTIAKEIESVGGVLNAFTSKEFTAYYCKILKEDLQLAIEVLTDIFLNSIFPDDEIVREKQVICQEIHQMEDNPEELIHELWGTKFWSAHALGQPVLGTIPNILSIDRETLIHYKTDHYPPTETMVVAAGNLDHEVLLELIAQKMHTLYSTTPRSETNGAKGVSSCHIEPRDLEQVHLCIGTNAPSAVDESRYAAYILNTILGGGMSSRLFQEIREKRGLAYSVYSFLSSVSDSGMLGIYLGCDPERFEDVVDCTGQVARELFRSVTTQEIDMAKNQIRGNILLALESSDAQMNRLAKEEYYFGRRIALEEIMATLGNVTESEITEVAENILNQDTFTLVALGPVKQDIDLRGLFLNH